MTDFERGYLQGKADAKKNWVGLEQSDMPDGKDPMFDHQYFLAGMVFAAKVLQEKNDG